MAVFNVGNMRKGAAKPSSGGSGYGILIDQLSILENELKRDGNLSPGDYDILIGEARKLASNPALTTDQRSNVTVKISSYESLKSSKQISRESDVNAMNREAEDDWRRSVKVFANDPIALADTKIALAQNKLQSIVQAIDAVESSGQDASGLYASQADVLGEMQDALDARQIMDMHIPKDPNAPAAEYARPSSDFVAYIDTNSRGEVVSVDFGRQGDKSGYVETDGLYGGLQIYGKARKVGDELAFRMGGTTFRGSSAEYFDPMTMKTIKPKLTSKPPDETGRFNIGTPTYTDVNLSTVRSQPLVRPGGFAQGRDGTLYEALDGGGYRKFVGALPDQFGLQSGDMMPLTSRDEDYVSSEATETVMGSAMPQMSAANPDVMRSFIDGGLPSPVPLGPPAPKNMGGEPEPEQPQSSQPDIRTRQPSPRRRSPFETGKMAQQTMSSARNLTRA